MAAEEDSENSPNVRVVLTGHGRGEVFVDGRKVEKVRSLTLSTGVGQTNVLIIEAIPASVEIVGPCDVIQDGT